MRSPKPLTVDVFELARERGLIEGDLPLDALPRLASSLLRADGALHFRIRGEIDAQSHPGAELHLRADLALQCQRCSNEMRYPLRRDVHFRFVGSDQELAAIPIVDDEVEIIVGSRSMAVAPWLEDEAILSLPVVPRHEDCRVLVASEVADEEPAPDRPNPFAALAALKAGRKPS